MTEPAADGKKQPNYVGHLLLPLTILSLSAVFFAQTLEFPTQEDVGPAAVPHLWILFTAIFCVQLIVQAARRKGKADPAPGRIGLVVLFVAWLTVYLQAIVHIGYFVSTFAFLVVSMYILTYRNVPVILIVSIGWLVFSYVVFYRMLFIPLPIGPLLGSMLG